MKTVQKIIAGSSTHVGTIEVQELLPSADGYANPFLVFHHGKAVIDPNIPLHQQGVGPHPHRGFSAISFIYKGGLHHQDSRGNSEHVYAGGTQWTHAGRGIIHSERPAANSLAHGKEQELLQVWVNSPAAHKMDEPTYHAATKENTPTIVENGVQVAVASGQINGTQGVIPTFTPVTTAMAHLQAGAVFTTEFPEHTNTIIYSLEGDITVNGTLVPARHLAQLSTTGTTVSVEAVQDARLFIGNGQPIEEPIAAHGPFVMNNQTEILQAFKDYQQGKMGVLIEEIPTTH